MLTCYCYLFTEPQIEETASDFQPLSEALNTIQLEKAAFVDELQPQMTKGILAKCLWGDCVFTESMRFEVSCAEVKEKVEDFEKVPLEHFKCEYCMWHFISKEDGDSFKRKSVITHLCPVSHVSVTVRSIVMSPTNTTHISHLMDSDSVAFHGEATSVTYGEVVKPAALFFSKPVVDTVEKVSEVATTSSWRSNISMSSENRRSGHMQLRMNNRRPPEEGLDPLSTFMILRSRQKSPATGEAHSSVGPAGTDPCYAATKCISCTPQTPDQNIAKKKENGTIEWSDEDYVHHIWMIKLSSDHRRGLCLVLPRRSSFHVEEACIKHF